MYSNKGMSKLKLPFTALTDNFKACKARNLVTFQESEDPCIIGFKIVVAAGLKTNTLKEINEAKARLKLQELQIQEERA